MIDRRSVWSVPRVQELLERFVPAADEVHRLQRVDGAEAELFREVAEQGHYAGRTHPTPTRQGIYALAPSGAFLGSWNSRRVPYVIEQLESALARFEEMDDDERFGAEEPPDRPPGTWRYEELFPEDGLALLVHARDLPRERRTEGWRGRAWNVDHAWLSADETRSLVPGAARPGAEARLDDRALHRLVRIHGRDVVRGQSPSYANEHVRRAELVSTVRAVDGDRIVLDLAGSARVEQSGRWTVRDGRGEDGSPLRHRGFDGRFVGRATWDAALERFVGFELAWAGSRWGATQYNGRSDDQAPAPMAVVFTLAPEGDRVAPSHAWQYGWR